MAQDIRPTMPLSIGVRETHPADGLMWVEVRQPKKLRSIFSLGGTGMRLGGWSGRKQSKLTILEHCFSRLMPSLEEKWLLSTNPGTAARSRIRRTAAAENKPFNSGFADVQIIKVWNNTDRDNEVIWVCLAGGMAVESEVEIFRRPDNLVRCTTGNRR